MLSDHRRRLQPIRLSHAATAALFLFVAFICHCLCSYYLVEVFGPLAVHPGRCCPEVENSERKRLIPPHSTS